MELGLWVFGSQLGWFLAASLWRKFWRVWSGEGSLEDGSAVVQRREEDGGEEEVSWEVLKDSVVEWRGRGGCGIW